jgi:hypothetical protein
MSRAKGLEPNLVAAIKDMLAAFKGKISLLLDEQISILP